MRSARRASSIVSGLARGIDRAAHDGALETRHDRGRSPAASTSSIRPRTRRGSSAIAERGLLIAEQPPGTEPRARHFPCRNRIIAGLALGTVVVEAAPRSGSLITARLAAEAGREVMAVPGSPLDPRAPGLQPADPRRRDAGPDRRGRARGDQPARRTPRSASPSAIRGRRRPADADDERARRVDRRPARRRRRCRSTSWSASRACRRRRSRRCCSSSSSPAGWSATPADG